MGVGIYVKSMLVKRTPDDPSPLVIAEYDYVTTLWSSILSRHASKLFQFCEFSTIYWYQFYDYNQSLWLESLGFSTSKIIYLVRENNTYY